MFFKSIPETLVKSDYAIKYRKAERRTEQIDILVGLLAFLSLAVFVMSVWTQFSSGNALVYSFVLIVLLVAFWVSLKKRKQYQEEFKNIREAPREN